MLLQGQTVSIVARDFIDATKRVRIAGLPPQGVAAQHMRSLCIQHAVGSRRLCGASHRTATLAHPESITAVSTKTVHQATSPLTALTQ